MSDRRNSGGVEDSSGDGDGPGVAAVAKRSALQPEARKVKQRKYKTGTKWCLWRWTDVDSEYITRLHLVKTPWFAICLHWINKPDPEPYLHDHPVTFLSIILRGWYQEWRHDPRYFHLTSWEANELRTNRWFNWLRATPDVKHTICSVAPHTLTLCFMGPKRREWGFHTPDGWVYWRDYYAKQREEKTRGAKSVRT